MKSIPVFLLCLLTLHSNSFSQIVNGFVENFNDNDVGWLVGEEETYSARIENGQYIIGNKDNNKLFSENIYINPEKDFYIEVKMTQLSGIEDKGYGIVFGMGDEKNNYNFVISSRGNYTAYGFNKNKYFSVKEETNSFNIYSLGKPNILGIKKKGKKLFFSINGEEEFSVPYKNFFGLGLGFVLDSRMKVSVDYIKVNQSNTINLLSENNANKKENLGPNLNSKYEEIMPVISQDGKTIYFDRKNHPENLGLEKNDDIWYSHYANDSWEKCRNIDSPLNNIGYNFVFSVSPDENTMLTANSYNPDGSPSGKGVSVSHKTATGWSIPEKLIIDDYYNNGEYVSFSLGADRKTLLMSVERSDTYGSYDIYVSFLKNDGTWSAPKNLGTTINTFGEEATPYLASDNVSLYYSTSGKPGYGGNDIFVSKRLDNSWTKWSEPVNLGNEINSNGWDAYYSVQASGEYAYFTSTQQSLGENDIFRIKLTKDKKPDPVVIIYGKVLNKETNKPLDGKITYYDLNTMEEVGIARIDPKDGSYKIVLPYGKSYGFHAEKEGYFSETDHIDLTQINEFQEIERPLLLAPISTGKKIALNNVFFVQSKAVLLPTSRPELEKLYKIMKENININIELQGHTDNVGNFDLNQKLSEARVEAIKKYLVKRGISSKRISGKGFGSTQPVASNDKEETRRLNRRVEFVILSQ